MAGRNDQPNWLGARCEHLFGELCVPVISPALFAGRRAALTSQSLTQVPLLTLANRPHTWDQWAVQAEVSLASGKPAARYEHFAMLAQAASAGAGAALLPDYLIEDELRDGRLIVVSEHTLASEGAYFLVYPEEKLEESAFRKFRDWLLTEARTGSCNS